MDFKFVDAGPGTNVRKIGFRYALVFPRKPDNLKELEDKLVTSLGPANKKYHYTYSLLVRDMYKEHKNGRWFLGTKSWNAAAGTQRYYPHWFVFKNESDRTLASLLI